MNLEKSIPDDARRCRNLHAKGIEVLFNLRWNAGGGVVEATEYEWE